MRHAVSSWIDLKIVTTTSFGGPLSFLPACFASRARFSSRLRLILGRTKDLNQSSKLEVFLKLL